MSGLAAIIVLGLVCAGLAALIAYRERRHDAERAVLLDRIQAPEVAQVAALQALPRPERAEPEPGALVAATDDDLILDARLEA